MQSYVDRVSFDVNSEDPDQIARILTWIFANCWLQGPYNKQELRGANANARLFSLGRKRGISE